MITIKDYLKAGYPALWIKTWEEERVIQELGTIAQHSQLGLQVWSVTKGWQDREADGSHPAFDPVSALECVENGNDDCIYVFINFHFYLDNVEVVQRIKDLIPIGKVKARHLLFLSCRVDLPLEIEKEISIIDYSLPSIEELDQVLNTLLSAVSMNVEVTNRKTLLQAALGLTCFEAENAFALALIKHKAFNDAAIQTVQTEKSNIIKKNGILEYIPPDFQLDDIGGLTYLKSWLKQRKLAFTDEAKQFGLPEPRGVLVAGVPGAGKSLTAKAVSASWGLPLLRFDVGKVFGSLVGQSEETMRNAIKTAETIAPCILWIDELEKAMAGLGGSGMSDSGVTARVFGTFLTWMQEKKRPVFVFATANNVMALPPELLRKGRFDEIFWVELPQSTEREEIFSIHLRKRNRNPDNYQMSELVRMSEGFSGSEIEEAVISGLYVAFDQGRELWTEDILQVLTETEPLSITMKEHITAVRDWAKNRARNASEPVVIHAPKEGTRRVTI